MSSHESGVHHVRRLIGRRVRRERRRLRLSQEQLAERLGFSHNYVAHLERGTRGLSLRTLARLATGLRLAPHRLLEPVPVKEIRDFDD